MWTSFQCLFVEHVSAPAFLIAAGKYQVANDSWVGKKCKSKANSMKLQCKIQIKKFFFSFSRGRKCAKRDKRLHSKAAIRFGRRYLEQCAFRFVVIELCLPLFIFFDRFSIAQTLSAPTKKRRLKCSNIFHFTSNSWSNNNHNNLEIENLLSCFDCVRRYYCSVDLKWRFYLRFFLLSSNPDPCMSLNIYGSQY